MSLIKWKEKKYDPVEAFFSFDRPFSDMNLFPLLDKSLGSFEQYWYPAVDISEDKDNITVKADLPGLKKEEVQVDFDDDILTIKGERKVESEKKDKNYHRFERAYGSFQRSIRLSSSIDKDKIKAAYKDGVLEVTAPKTEQAKPKQVKIDVN